MPISAKLRQDIAKRKVVALGKHSVSVKKGEKKKLDLYGNFSLIAQKALGQDPISPKQVREGRTLYIFGGKSKTVKVRLKKKGAATSGYKSGVVTIRVPGAMTVEAVADFLNTKAGTTAKSFQMNGRGRYYDLEMFKTTGGGAAAS